MPMSPRLLSPKAASGFNPRAIAGLEAWWDAADSASVTLDSGRVSQLNDKSGNGRHAANTTSGSTQPTYQTAATNGRNVVRYAQASTQRLTVANSTATFNFTHNGSNAYIVAVASFAGSSNPGNGHYLLGNAAGGSANRGLLFGYEDESPFNNAFSCSIFRAAIGAPALQVISNNRITPQSPTLLEALIDADNATADNRARLRVDGGAQFGGNTSTPAPTAGNASFDLQLGAAGNNSFPMTGDLCEVLIYSQHPTADAQTAIRRYLGRKWGVTIP